MSAAILLSSSPSHNAMNLITADIQRSSLPPLSQPQPSLLWFPTLPSKHLLSLSFSASRFPTAAAFFAGTAPPSSPSHIEMVRNLEGSWSAREQKVVVLWDLDNKPPRGPPYSAALSLRRVAELFGRVIEISAYANRHAFLHLPQWVVDHRRDRRRLDALERKGLAVRDDPYICCVCGRKCRTNLDLKRHFQQLHERERQKKLARMRSLKGKKRQKYKERFVSGNQKYTEAARELLTPKTGYGLASELRRAGVLVKTVEDKPQAADSAVKRQMHHSMTRGIDCLILVSDDSDFSEMIRRAREGDLRTVVIGDGRRALGGSADFWIPWRKVENGEVGDEVLVSRRNQNGGFQESGGDEDDEEGVFYSSASSDDYDDEDDDDLDDSVDEVIVRSSGYGAVKVSAFSEEHLWDGDDVRGGTGDDISGILGASPTGTSLSWTSEDEDGDFF